jgi:hypothetical protein
VPPRFPGSLLLSDEHAYGPVWRHGACKVDPSELTSAKAECVTIVGINLPVAGFDRNLILDSSLLVAGAALSKLDRDVFRISVVRHYNIYAAP